MCVHIRSEIMEAFEKFLKKKHRPNEGKLTGENRQSERKRSSDGRTPESDFCFFYVSKNADRNALGGKMAAGRRTSDQL